MTLKASGQELTNNWETKGEEAIPAYRDKKNNMSGDGLPTDRRLSSDDFVKTRIELRDGLSPRI